MKKIHEYIHKRNRDKFYSKHIFDGSKIRLLCLHILNKNNLISPLARISKGIYLPHPLGIVIGKGVTIGKNCTIFQNVTIGQKKEGEYPIIGNNVTIYANSVVIGNVEIGDNVIIGAGSLVNKSFPSDVVVAGNPAKIIKRRN